MPRNVITAGKSSMTGLHDLAVKLDDLALGFSGQTKNALLVDVMGAIGVTAREEIAERAKQIARGSGVPEVVVDSIFVDQRLSGVHRNRPTVLAGVNKQASMVEWTANDHPTSPRAKVPAGGKVSESLASMFEFGTSRMRPKPFMRRALEIARTTIIYGLGDKLTGVITKWARR